MDLDRGLGHTCLRSYLREQTSELHQRLDAQVGSFASTSQYRNFVEQGFRFRNVAEPACAGFPGWSPHSLVEDMRRDLLDLDCPVPTFLPSPIAFQDDAARLGAFYVLEGSSLGARLLIRRAEALGFSAAFGARHLVRQSGDRERWRSFLEVLDASTHAPQAVLVGAIVMFEAALDIYTEALVG